MYRSIVWFTTPPGQPRAFTKNILPTPGRSLKNIILSWSEIPGYDLFGTFLCVKTTDFSHFPLPNAGIPLEFIPRLRVFL